MYNLTWGLIQFVLHVWVSVRGFFRTLRRYDIKKAYNGNQEEREDPQTLPSVKRTVTLVKKELCLVPSLHCDKLKDISLKSGAKGLELFISRALKLSCFFFFLVNCFFCCCFFSFVYYPSERRAEWLNISPCISRMTTWNYNGLNVNSCCGQELKLQSLVVSCSIFVQNIHKHTTTSELCWKALHVDAVFCHNLTNILNMNMLRPLLLYFVSYSWCFFKKHFLHVFLGEIENMIFPQSKSISVKPEYNQCILKN